MKLSYSLMPLFALRAAAAPSGTLEARNAAPISGATVSLIETLEGFSANFYTIDGHPTIGFGHDCVERGCSNIHPPLSRAQATALFYQDVVQYESCVCAMPNAKYLNANQYGALVSFTYNSGCQGSAGYWNGFMAARNFQGICNAMPNTNTLGGQLSNRRRQESTFCSKPTSAKSGCA